uniref:Uncharacterized protein n=1 Tax=Quercus lobata TaxID=97700 RepID=A0A7N2N2E5_QUELO
MGLCMITLLALRKHKRVCLYLVVYLRKKEFVDSELARGCCKGQPEKALYNGGILKDDEPVSVKGSVGGSASIVFWPAFLLHNLTRGTYFCFSSKVLLLPL